MSTKKPNPGFKRRVREFTDDERRRYWKLAKSIGAKEARRQIEQEARKGEVIPAFHSPL
jgi:hypothetical protein